jgi:hypothetical protein
MREVPMDYSVTNLKYKILELYPEIVHYGIDIFLTYDPEKGRYGIKLTMPSPETTVFLDQKDADACMEGQKFDFLAQSFKKFITQNR